MSNSDKFVAMVGFARRAGKIVYGLDGIRVSRKRMYVLAVGDTASDNLEAAMKSEAEKRGLPLILAETLEASAGGNTKAIGITDEAMARAMTEYAETAADKYKIINR